MAVLAFLLEFLTSTVSEVIATVFLSTLLIPVVRRSKPISLRWLSGLWSRSWSTFTADYPEAKSTPCWHKALAGFLLVYGVGGVLAYALTGSMNDAAPVWAVCWAGSVSLALWGYAGWMAVRWAMRQIRGLLV